MASPLVVLACAFGAGAASNCAAGNELGTGGVGGSVASSSSSTSGSSSSQASSSSSGTGGASSSSSSSSSSSGGGGVSSSSSGTGGSVSSSSSSGTGGSGGMAPAPTVSAIDPTNTLFSLPTEGVVISGLDFASGAAVKIAGVNVPTSNCDYAGVPAKIVCTVPAAAAVVRGDVVVTNPDTQSGSLANGFTYTGVVSDANFCNVQYPKDLTQANALKVGASVDVFGQVYEPGQTDVNTQPVSTFAGDLGLSPVNPSGGDLSPLSSTRWRFYKATPNPGFNFSQNNDEYMGTLTPAAAGTYRYVFRFTFDGGLNYTYCDKDDANGGFDSSALSQMDVNP